MLPHGSVVLGANPPAQVQHLAAVAASPTEIDLTWDAVTGATVYVVEESADGSAWANLATPGTNSYHDTGLTLGQLRYYRVSASRAGETGPPSAVVYGFAGADLWVRGAAGVFQERTGASATTPSAADTNPVGSWLEQSGNARHLTAAADGQRPVLKLARLNGHPAVLFDGIDDALKSAGFGPLAQPNHVFLVLKIVNYVNNRWIFDGATAFSQALVQYSPSPWLGLYAGSGAAQNPGAVIGAFQLVECVFNGPNSSLIVDGGAPTTNDNVGSGTLAGFILGNSAAGGAASNIEVAEVIAFHGQVSGAPLTGVRAYADATYRRSMVLGADGNSQTFGTGSTAGHDYPHQVLPLLTGRVCDFHNFGVPSQVTGSMTGDAATQIDPLIQASKRNVLVAWEITNDLYYGADQATAIANFVAYCQGRQAAGWQVVALTILPRDDSPPAGFETDRIAINAYLRANWRTFADGLADVAADARIGVKGDEHDSTYYYDTVHPNDTGYGVVASIVAPVINALP